MVIGSLTCNDYFTLCQKYFCSLTRVWTRCLDCNRSLMWMGLKYSDLSLLLGGINSWKVGRWYSHLCGDPHVRGCRDMRHAEADLCSTALRRWRGGGWRAEGAWRGGTVCQVALWSWLASQGSQSTSKYTFWSAGRQEEVQWKDATIIGGLHNLCHLALKFSVSVRVRSDRIRKEREI